jgi:hypothetical protein
MNVQSVQFLAKALGGTVLLRPAAKPLYNPPVTGPVTCSR